MSKKAKKTRKGSTPSSAEVQYELEMLRKEACTLNRNTKDVGQPYGDGRQVGGGEERSGHPDEAFT